MQTIYTELLTLIEQGRPCALVTLIATQGSSPQNVGAKVIVLPDGRLIGTIGGGCLEAEARRVALECLRKREARRFDMRLDDDFGWDDGLICGGRVSVFVEPGPASSAGAYAGAAALEASRGRGVLCVQVDGGWGTALLDAGGAPVEGLAAGLPGEVAQAAREAVSGGRARTISAADGRAFYLEPIVPRPVALVAGAGHIGQAVAQVAALCGFDVVVVDDRPSFASRERLPWAGRVAVEDIPRFVADFPIDGETYLVIVTRGHRHDAQVLRECIHSPARYIGMIGSKRKIAVIYQEMLREGLATPEELRRVCSPMGLELGAREVGEIAVSIVSEMVAVRRGAAADAIRPMQYHPPCIRP